MWGVANPVLKSTLSLDGFCLSLPPHRPLSDHAGRSSEKSCAHKVATGGSIIKGAESTRLGLCRSFKRMVRDQLLFS